jgi:hypothetical protein
MFNKSNYLLGQGYLDGIFMVFTRFTRPTPAQYEGIFCDHSVLLLLLFSSSSEGYFIDIYLQMIRNIKLLHIVQTLWSRTSVSFQFRINF